ncbi:amino acid ABC transporter ATP-binding protein (PAAT family) [Hypnocyclicus thermotrophus]|uniref:Amino acid ABC transporter ATP-binding protein (PAAT family) n=1 Tax=Hypnocyclicus thermotrophus TaxID=1627895 RepID=A0AA46DZ46_9FUSO|nr:amino acid ABC transporter ATP-binding protein (PAAT family) [Hypnocyclicus thermotrophus]
MDIIQLENITKYYGDFKVLDNISLNIKKGEIISIIGPSGSGKSTLLRSLIQLEKINSGKLIVENTIIFDNNKKIDKKLKKDILLKMGMIFQNFNLFPHKTVLENVCEPLILVNKTDKKEARKTAIDLLKKVQMDGKENNYPDEISGGQKQRVAIARALALNPDIILFDEPTSALDPELVNEVLNVIKNLADGNITMLIVSHQMNFVKEISDRIIFMDKGKVLTIDTPKNIFSSENKRINDFFSIIKK